MPDKTYEGAIIYCGIDPFSKKQTYQLFIDRRFVGEFKGRRDPWGLKSPQFAAETIAKELNSRGLSGYALLNKNLSFLEQPTNYPTPELKFRHVVPVPEHQVRAFLSKLTSLLQENAN